MTHQRRFAAHLGVRAPDMPLFRTLARSSDPIDQIRFAAAEGLGGISDNFLMLRPLEMQAAIGAEVERLGLVLSSFVLDPVRWDQPMWSARDEAARTLLREALMLSLGAAVRSGGRRIVCPTGREPAISREVQLEAMATNLRWAGDLAGERGISLCVEVTHPAFAPGALIERLNDALNLLARTDHASVRLNLDIGHLALHGEDIPSAIETSRGWIGMVQLADVPGRIEPGAGRLPWRAILGALDRIGYVGLLELELEPSRPGAAGERGVLDRLRHFGS